MILDAFLLLSDAQALAATGYSTNTIDLGPETPAREVGTGEPLALVVTCDVALAGTTPTLDVQLVQSANANLSAHDVIGAAQQVSVLAVGAVIVVPAPYFRPDKRYLGARYVLGGTTPTVTLTATVLPMSMIQAFKAYPDGFTIS